MPDRIDIKGLIVLGRHGVYQFEKENAQPWVIDLSLYVDTRAAGQSDSLADTVSYVDVIDAVKDMVETKTFSLIEFMAEQISVIALADARVTSVDVTVKKPQAAVGALIDYTAVSIHRP